MTATLRFMDSPATTGAVRLDLNPDRRFYPADLDPGVPSMEGDPDGVGVEYGFRTVSWTQVVLGSKMDALQAQSQLARELLRRENWLMFQVDPTVAPVWFKTYRTEPGSLSLEHVYEDGADVWQIAVTVTADPFAYGERVTLPTVTVKNDPAATTNPMSYALPTIAGDAPTPAVFQVIPSAQEGPVNLLLSSTPFPAGSTPTPRFYQIGTGDNATAGTDTSAPVADAAYSGGSYRTVSFATDATMVRRLTLQPSSVPPGRYKILVRAARSDTTSKFLLNLEADYITGGDVPFNRGTSPSVGYAEWVNLGTFTLPSALADKDAPASDVIPLWLNASRTSGTGSLRLDAYLLIPIEVGDATASTLEVVLAGLYASPKRVVVNGEGEWVQAYNGTAATASFGLPPRLKGAFPRLWPGRSNLLHFLHRVGSELPSGFYETYENGDKISDSVSLTISYQPRFLYLGGLDA